MSPAALKRALDPAYIGSPFAQLFQFFDGAVSTPMDLTGRSAVLFLDKQGLPDDHHEITGAIQADGRVLFSAADTSAWLKGDYSVELRLDGVSVVVGRLPVAKGAAATGADMVGAAQPPTAPGVVISGTGVVQIVSVAPSAATDPSAILLPADLSAALGGAQTLAGALLWLAQNGGGSPSPIVRNLIGNVVISSVASGALLVTAAAEVVLSGAVSIASGVTGTLTVTSAGQIALSGSISGASSATGSLTVGAASSLALVGSVVSTSSLVGAMTVVQQIALAGAIAGTSAVAGSLSVSAPTVTYLPSSPAPQIAYSNERLWQTYSGAALRSVRPSDGATLDFPFGSDGTLDTSGYASFAGAGDLMVSEWKDQAFVVNGGSADANNAIQTTAANRPRFRAGNAMRGKQPISTGMQIDGRIANDRCFALPAIANTRRSVTRMWVGSLIGGTFNSIGVWGLGTNAGTNDNLSLLYDTTNGKAAFYTLDSNFNSGIGGPPTAELAIFTYVSGPASRSLYVNGQLVNTLASPATDIALTGGWVGRGSWSAATNGPAEFAADIVWSTPLSDSDRIAFETVLAARFGITYAAYGKLIAYNGHSIIAGMNESGYFQNLPRLINNAWSGALPKTPNFGVAGQTALEIFNRRAATATAASAAGFAKKAHVICMATNSVENLASGSIVGGGATIYSTYILPYIQYMQTTGGFGTNVIYLTDPPRGWTGSSTDISQKEAEMQSIISLLKADASGQGFTVVDWHNMPEMTTGSASGGNPRPPNPAYYGSGTTVHPSPAGYAVVAPTLKAALESMLA